MGYTINLIQRVSDGGIWTGDRFIELSSQADYSRAQFITGDPENIPDNFGGLGVGEYRVMTFLTYGNSSTNFPMYQGTTFSNFNTQNTATNAVDINFVEPYNGFILLEPSSPFEEAFNRGQRLYVLFTDAQISTYGLQGYGAVADAFGDTYPEYAGLFYMDVESDGRNFFTGGYSETGGTISALYLFN
jgi:hypothetical protein